MNGDIVFDMVDYFYQYCIIFFGYKSGFWKFIIDSYDWFC